ncbi:adenylate cyclase [Kineosphaera limosa NBRC 100340]|uniref:Adenylate cyclase n=2 Tax=Kineosphaera TaxID=211469 RepID=K6WWI6_9MICO|nr:adenylate cyclase [Kineosphaera limosa NBRC 100340]
MPDELFDEPTGVASPMAEVRVSHESDEALCQPEDAAPVVDAAADTPADAVEAADAVARLLGPACLDRTDIAANTGIPPERTLRFWQALGFAAAPTDTDARYTPADEAAIKQVIAYLATGDIDEEMALAMTRAIARSVGRLASWQASLVMEEAVRSQVMADEEPDADNPTDQAAGDATSEPGGALPGNLSATLAREREADEALWNRKVSPELSRAAGERLLGMVDDIEPMIIYAWKRHLAATIGRLMTNDAESEADGAQRSVGFADMVGFTTLVRRLSERQLARLVGQFEVLASEIVASHGGQIVKMLGDEVVYVADTPGCAAAIALDLLEAVAQDAAMPDLRIGMAHGPVLAHLGDVFGTTVNRASRLTNLAQPHTVVVDDSMASHLQGAPGVEMSRLPPRALRGLGMTVVWHLWRAPQVQPGS